MGILDGEMCSETTVVDVEKRSRRQSGVRVAFALVSLSTFLLYSNFYAFDSKTITEYFVHSQIDSPLSSNPDGQQSGKINWNINKEQKSSIRTVQAMERDANQTKAKTVGGDPEETGRKRNGNKKIDWNINKGNKRNGNRKIDWNVNKGNKNSTTTLEKTEGNANHTKAKKRRRQRLPPFDGEFFFSDFKLAWEEMEDHPTAGFIAQDAFSAAWWQSKSNFLRYKTVEQKSPSPEGASFEVFSINERRMRITRDWADLNVEHMSKWWRMILNPDYNKDPGLKYFGRILQIFEDYVYSKDRSHCWKSLDANQNNTNNWLGVSQSTIAVIAFMPYSDPLITKWSLAATLMSLVQLGVGRIVVSGAESDKEGEQMVQGAWNEIINATKDWKTSETKQMASFGFCNCGDADSDWPGEGPNSKNIPKAALRRLRHVFLKEVSNDLRTCWAGPAGKKNLDEVLESWKYVFLGEPDLILNTRPSAIYKLGKALIDGGVLAPHRLQPIPHDSDFGYEHRADVLGFLVPNTRPTLNKVIEIDHYRTSSSQVNETASTISSCCDDGNHKPYMELEDCGTWWYECGYSVTRKWIQNDRSLKTMNTTLFVEAHRRISLYPLTRLKRGTGVVFLGAESGRRCLPSKNGCIPRNTA